MALKELYHNDFSKGLITKVAPHLLPEGASPSTVNFDISASVGSLTKRAGQAAYSTPSPAISSGTSVTGFYEFITSAGALKVLAATNDDVYNVSGNTWTSIYNAAGLNSSSVNFAQMSNLLIIVSPNITTQKWTGAGSSSNLGGSPPANVKYTLTHGERLWMFNSSAGKSRAHYSAQGNPEDWTTTGDTGAGYVDLTIDDGDQITGAASVGGALIVFKNHSTFYIYGYKPSNFVVKQISSAIGCVAPRSVVATDNQVFFLSTDGVYVANPNMAPIQASDNIRSDITSLSSTVKAAAAAGRLRNQYWLSYDSDADNVNDAAFVLDYVDGAWMKYTNIKASVFLTMRDGTFYSGGSDSVILRQHDTTSQDSGSTITAVWKSKVFDDNSFVDDKSLMDFWLYADGSSSKTLTLNTFLNGVQNADAPSLSLTPDDPSSSGTTVMVKTNLPDTVQNRNYQFQLTDANSNYRSRIHAFSVMIERRERQN